MNGIPPDLFTPIREALLASGVCDSDNTLAAVFAHALLAPWRDRLPQVSNRTGRTEAVMAFLADQRHAGKGQNALVILLEVLRDRAHPDTEEHHTLARLADQLAQALTAQAKGTGIPDSPNGAAIQAWLDGSRFDDPFSALIEDRTRNFTGREWVFNAVGSWLAQTSGGVFLLTGEPGTGKTAVAARLVQFSAGAVVPPEGMSLPGPPFLAAVHFCSTRLGDSLDPRLVAGSLARQLAARYPTFRQALFAGAPNPGDLHSAQEWWHTFLRKPLAALAGTPITILVDSLDEGAHHEGRETVVDLLAGCAGWSGVRWLLTTRDEGGIPRRFAVPPFDLIKDAPRDVHEVRAYAAARLAGELPPEVLPSEERADLAMRLAQPDLGNFLYARYMLDDLLPRLQAGGTPELAHLPHSLNALYAEFLGRAVNSASADWPDRYRPLLGAVAVSQGEGLDRDTLAAVTGLGRQVVSDSLRPLHAYIIAPTPTGPYHLYHQSFGDFLLHEADNPDFWIDPAAVHRHLAEWGMASGSRGWEQAPPYAVRYTPTHLLTALEAGDAAAGSTLVELLTDLGYLAARLALDAGNTWPLEQEFTRADTTRLDDTSRFLVSAYGIALRLESHALHEYPGDLYPQLYNRLWRNDDGPVDRRLKTLKTEPRGPWLRITRPLPVSDPRLNRMLIGHIGGVTAVGVAADGRVVVSGSTDGSIRLWDLSRGQESRVLGGHGEGVRALAVTHDGRVVVSGGIDGIVRLWNLNRSHKPRVLGRHPGGTRAVAMTRDGRMVVSGGTDGIVRLWDFSRGQEPQVLRGHLGQVNAVAVTGDGRVVSGDRNGTVWLWDLSREQEPQMLGAHIGPVWALAVTEDGRVVSGGSDGTVRLWYLSRRQEPQVLSGPGEEIRTVAVTGDGRIAVSGGAEGTVQLWDLSRGRKLRVLRGHSGGVWAVAVTQDGRMVVSGGQDRTVCTWNTIAGSMNNPVIHAAQSVYSGGVTGDGRMVVSGGTDGIVRLWDLSRGQEPQVLRAFNARVNAVAMTADGQIVVWGGQDGMVWLWDLSRGQEPQVLGIHRGGVRGLAVTQNGRVVVSGGVDRIVRLWDLSHGREIQVLHGHQGLVTAVGVTADGQVVVSGGADGAVLLWDLSRGQEPQVLARHGAGVRALAVTHDGRVVVSGGADRIVRLWKLSPNQKLRALHGHTGWVRTVAVTQDGQVAVSGGDDRMLRVWDGESGMELARYKSDTRFVFCTISSDTHTIYALNERAVLLTFRLEAHLTFD